ncbi:MAG: hypothetical protein IJA20_02400 [Methanocorpusculum sp.]|nr:hypothetical protein [Oscillospiraceae bacterium]MBQ3569504.1 hypothetical protein [Methanocorpusculum sp.]
MTIDDFILEHCYEGQKLLITGIGPDAEEFYEGQYKNIDDIPEKILESNLAFVWASEEYTLVLECDYEGEE